MFNTAVISNIDVFLLRKQIVALTKVIVTYPKDQDTNHPSTFDNDIELLEGALHLLEHIYDDLNPPSPLPERTNGNARIL